MTELLRVENGEIGVTSKVIADSFGKVHRDVLRAIDDLDCSESFRARNFAHSSYTSAQGKNLPCMLMTKDGFCFLAMGFTGAKAATWKEAFIDAFNQMSEAATSKKRGVMDHYGEVLAIMESDKDKASIHGKALAEWRKARKQHIEDVSIAHSKAQILLNFKD